MHVIFSLPEKALAEWFSSGNFPHEYLAYVEWFSAFSQNPEPNHELFKISRSFKNEQRLASIIPVNNIRQSIHLFPSYGPIVPQEWSSSSVLDKCRTFFVNSTTDQYIYATLI